MAALLYRSPQLSFIIPPVLVDMKERSCNYAWSGLQPDPEELCDFTDLYGSLRLLLSFQVHRFSVMLLDHDTEEKKYINIAVRLYMMTVLCSNLYSFMLLTLTEFWFKVIAVKLLVTYFLLQSHLSVKMKLVGHLGDDWCSRVEEFLHTFSLANAGVRALSSWYA